MGCSNESAGFFFLDCDVMMFGLMNLCNVDSVVWFLDDRKPLFGTSKQFTLHFYSVMSVVKFEYLLLVSDVNVLF